MTGQRVETESQSTDAFVACVEHRLDGVVESHLAPQDDKSRIADAAAGHLTAAPAAKRARPRIVHHFGTAVGVSASQLVDIAVAAEFVHTASLLHDDVIDEAADRRGVVSANARFGNQVAILGGDLLLCYGLKLLEPYSSAVYHSSLDVVMEMARGIVREVEARWDISVTTSQWEQIAMGKTAALLGWCGRAPALAAERRDLAERFDQCGRHLGIAFQIADDLKDLLEVDTGKPRFADIRNGNPSYVLARAAQHDEACQRALADCWEAARRGDVDEARVDEIGELVLESGAIPMAVEEIDRRVVMAIGELGDAAERPGGASIRRWAQLVLQSVGNMAHRYL